ncbi:MAG: SURF1 family protein [Betaproteobacteria bacterium]
MTLVVLFLGAAYWQYTRMEDKLRQRAALDTATAAAPIALPQGVDDWSKLRFRRVRLAGHYDAAQQILIDNRIDDGRVGYHVVTPFVLDDGRAVLVDRGFVPRGATRSNLPEAPVAKGDVEVRGRIELPRRYFELGHPVPVGNLWQNLDPAKFAATTGVDVLPIVIEQDAGDPRVDGLVRNWPAPDFGVDTNRSYMLQWIAFAGVVASLWFWFRVLRK